MPFANRVASMVFNAATIQREALAAPGVYGLSNARQWLYVAQSDNIRESLLAHLMERDTELSNLNPSGFTFEVSDGNHRAARREQLATELKPVVSKPSRVAPSSMRGSSRK